MLGIAQDIARLKNTTTRGNTDKTPPRYRYKAANGETITGRLYQLLKYKHPALKDKTVEQRLRYGWDINRALDTPPRDHKAEH